MLPRTSKVAVYIQTHLMYVVTDIEVRPMVQSVEAQFQQNQWACDGLQCFK